MSTSSVPVHIPASQAAFLDDVGRVLRVWRRAPLLPLITLVLAGTALLTGSAQPGLALLAGIVGVLFLGWPGAQRLWYLRLWTGRDLTLGQAWRANLRCFGRFLVLGLAVGAVFLVLGTPLYVALAQVIEIGDDGAVSLGEGLPLWATAYGALLGVLGYALLTFVAPAIVYSSKRVRDAVPIGLRLLRVSWPRTAAYVLVPAVLAGAPSLFLGFEPLAPSNALAGLFAAVVLALGRGAVAAYYLRTVPGAGPDGAVRLADEPGYYPPPSGW